MEQQEKGQTEVAGQVSSINGDVIVFEQWQGASRQKKIINNESHVSSKKLAGTSACTEWCWAAQEKLLITQNHLLGPQIWLPHSYYSSLSLSWKGDIPKMHFMFVFFYLLGLIILYFECRTGVPNPNQEGPAMSRLTYFFIGKVWKASK